jgi:hypothetical protein
MDSFIPLPVLWYLYQGFMHTVRRGSRFQVADRENHASQGTGAEGQHGSVCIRLPWVSVQIQQVAISEMRGNGIDA